MIEYLVFPPVSHWVYKCITNFLSFQYEDIAVYAITLVISNQYSVQIYLHWKGVYNCFVILNMFHQHIHTIRFFGTIAPTIGSMSNSWPSPWFQKISSLLLQFALFKILVLLTTNYFFSHNKLFQKIFLIPHFDDSSPSLLT